MHDQTASIDMQLSVIRAVLDPCDLHAPNGTAELQDQTLAEIVRVRTLVLHAVHVHDDGVSLRLTNPNRQHARAVLLLQDEDIALIRRIEPEPRHNDFDHTSPTLSGPPARALSRDPSAPM